MRNIGCYGNKELLFTYLCKTYGSYVYVFPVLITEIVMRLYPVKRLVSIVRK